MPASGKDKVNSAKDNDPGGSRTVARGTGSTPGKDKVQDDLQFQSESVAQFEDGSFGKRQSGRSSPVFSASGLEEGSTPMVQLLQMVMQQQQQFLIQQQEAAAEERRRQEEVAAQREERVTQQFQQMFTSLVQNNAGNGNNHQTHQKLVKPDIPNFTGEGKDAEEKDFWTFEHGSNVLPSTWMK